MRPLIALLAALSATAADRTIQSEQEVGTLAFTADGRYLAGVCRDQKVRLWDVASGQLARTLKAGERGGVTLAPGGNFYAVSGPEKIINVYGSKDGELLHQLRGHYERIGRVAFSQDNKSLASSSGREQSIRVWDLPSASQRLTLPDGIGGAGDIAFSPKGDIVVSSNYDTDIRVWETKTGKLTHTIQDVLVAVFALSFSPDGSTLAAAGVDRNVYLWNTKDWSLVRKLSGQPEMVSSMTFSPDGRLIVTGGFDSDAARNPTKVMLWDVSTGKVLRTMESDRRVASVVFSPDSSMVAVANNLKTVNLWKTAKP